MNETSARLTIRGARGSTPVSGREVLRYGGQTTCLDVALAPDHHLIIDAGTGLRSVERDLASSGVKAARFDVLFTHYHWDHLQGLPFFTPLYLPSQHFVFHGFAWEGRGVQEILERALDVPWFPQPLATTPSRKDYVDLDGAPLTFGGITVRSTALRHPQGARAFRLERNGRSIVFATDHERGDPHFDDGLTALARGADVLIHDAHYTPDEYHGGHRGWGHSTWQHATAAARDAGVGRLILFHHDPERTDEALDALVEAARREFEPVEAACRGMTLPL